MLPVTGFSILDICFIFFLWHSVACYSGFSILIYQRKKIKQISRMENPESQATLCQRKKIKQISRMENPVTGNIMPEKEDKTNIKNGKYSVACDSAFSILDIRFIFFLWHSVACDSGFSIPDI
jgi:hypothetical protein